MDYPKTFSSCPNCGCTETFAQLETEEEIKKGNLPENVRIPTLVTQTRVCNPQDNRVLLFRRQFPILIGFYDTCSNCGTLYCREMIKQIGVLDVGIKGNHGQDNSHGQDIPPVFGRG